MASNLYMCIEDAYTAYCLKLTTAMYDDMLWYDYVHVCVHALECEHVHAFVCVYMYI